MAETISLQAEMKAAHARQLIARLRSANPTGSQKSSIPLSDWGSDKDSSGGEMKKIAVDAMGAIMQI